MHGGDQALVGQVLSAFKHHFAQAGFTELEATGMTALKTQPSNSYCGCSMRLRAWIWKNSGWMALRYSNSV